MKPNLFNFATKELSQDAFFTWFLNWANNELNELNPSLNETAKDFIKTLIGVPNNYIITKVIAGRQWNNIDIWAEVNDEYFIGIEDKTNTGEHSNQLERYKEIVTKHYKDKPHKTIFIYLKTGNESLSTLNLIKQKGYKSIDRKAILDIFNKRQINSEIFNDFKEYLTEIENSTNSFNKFHKITSDWKASEGFYLKLQENIDEWTDWRYVANQMGGFLGFWYHWKGTKEISEIYIQIENAFNNGIKLVIKIAGWEQKTHILYHTLNELKPFAERNNIIINKPDKYRTGNTSTLAVVQNAFQTDDDGNFDFELFLVTLRNLEKTIDEYCCNKKTQQVTQVLQDCGN